MYNCIDDCMELLPLHKTYNWGSFFTQKKCLHRDLFCLFIRYTLMYKHSELFLKLERHFRSYRKRTILMYFLSFKSSKLETPFRVFPLATLCKWKQVTNDWCNVTRNDQTTLLLIHKLCNPMLSFKCFLKNVCFCEYVVRKYLLFDSTYLLEHAARLHLRTGVSRGTRVCLIKCRYSWEARGLTTDVSVTMLSRYQRPSVRRKTNVLCALDAWRFSC